MARPPDRLIASDHPPTSERAATPAPPRVAWPLCLLLLLGACGTDETVADGDKKVEDAAQDLDTQIEETVSDASRSGCKTHGDCAGEAALCNAGTGQCVRCLLPGDCPDPNARCVGGECRDAIACKSDKACLKAGAVCDAGGGFCVDCVSDDDCEGATTCKLHQCVPPAPKCTTSKECKDSGGVCDKAAGHCVQCLGHHDCDPDRHCSDGICAPDVCVGGEKKCLTPAKVGVCSARGEAFDAKDCGGGQVCEDGECLEVICPPGEKSCVDGEVATCKETGTAWVDGQACGPGQTCVAGSCQDHKCEPAQSKCEGAAILTCNDDGMGWATKLCPDGSDGQPASWCGLGSEGPLCKAQICKPGTSSCDKGKAILCDDSGLSTSLVQDCTLPDPGGGPGMTCISGKCVALKCVPGKKHCVGGVLVTCADDGLSVSQTTCGPDKVCHEGACEAVVCVAGALYCDGKLSKKCNDQGTGAVVVDNCPGSNKTCSQGKCVDYVCTPNAIVCSADGGEVQSCKADGMAYVAVSCGEGTTCVAAKCLAVVCEANKLLCKGQDVHACNKTGTASSFLATCAADKLCLEGACVPKVCTPGSVQCDGIDKLLTCNSSGVAWDTAKCDPGTACDKSKCLAQTCSPNATKCAGKSVHVCDGKGLGWTEAADCAAKNQTCMAGKCVDYVCKPGEKACKAGKLAVCATDGMSWVKSNCGAGTVCEAGTCAAVICKPGALSCKGAVVQMCSSPGTKLSTKVDCAKSKQGCAAGKCVPLVCAPGQAKCDGKDRAVCAGDGMSWKKEVCPDGSICDGAKCEKVVCPAGKAFCQGKVVALCNGLGTSSKTDTDCAKSGKTCLVDMCVAPLCQPGATKCGPGALMTCEANGLGWKQTVCPKGQACEGGKCLKITCKPGESACVGFKVMTCIASGTGKKVSKDCAETDEACHKGACVNKVCEPGTKACSQVDVATCQPDALTWTITKCGDGHICDNAVCKKVVCQGGKTWCDLQANAVKVCNGLGTAAAVKAKCKSGEACEIDTCKKVICKANYQGCKDIDTMTFCNGTGTSWEEHPCGQDKVCYNGGCPYKVCEPDELMCEGMNAVKCEPTGLKKVILAQCDKVGKVCLKGACVNKICTPSSVSCVGGQVGTCKADGLGWVKQACDDGNGCTSNGCKDGKCAFGPVKDCDDGNACTADKCDPNTGKCVLTPVAGGCDDGTKCTLGEHCQQGVCKEGAVGTVVTLAGTGAMGSADGPAGQATFNNPWAVTQVGDGAIWIADLSNHRIRRLKDGTVTTVAGGIAGYADGKGSAARFKGPTDLEVGPSGAVWVADQGNNRIRKVTPDGTVTTVAGSGQSAHADGQGVTARFKSPHGIALGPNGYAYVADWGNHRIRKVSPSGKVTTIAGSGIAGMGDGQASWARFYYPAAVTVDAKGTVYVADYNNHRIRKITAGGTVSTIAGGTKGFLDGTGSKARFYRPQGIALGPDGRLVVADTYNHRIRLVDPNGVVTTLAGTGSGSFLDGPADLARMHHPLGLAFDSWGRVVFADRFNKRIRRITLPKIVCDDHQPCTKDACDAKTGECSFTPQTGGACEDGSLCTLKDECDAKGQCVGAKKDCDDGEQCTEDLCDGSTGKCTPVHLAIPCDDGDGCSVGDFCENGKCAPGKGTLSTVAGSGAKGSLDGPAASAQLFYPLGVAVGGGGDIYVCDSGNHRIRKIASGGEVSTVAGSTQGFQDGNGPVARFSSPLSLVAAKGDVLFVADYANHRVRRIGPSGVVSTFAGSGTAGYVDGKGTSATFNKPRSLALGPDGTLYLGEDGNHRIRKIGQDGVVGTLAGSGQMGYQDGPGSSARFKYPRGLTVGPKGNVYVADAGNHRVRKVTPSGVVSTVAGSGTEGWQDGAASSARFRYPSDVLVDAFGNLLVADTVNHRIRSISPGGTVSTVSGGAAGFLDGAAAMGRLNMPYGLAMDAAGAIVIGDHSNHRIRRIVSGQAFCNDSSPCTSDGCDKKTGKCVYLKAQAGTPCDDGDACTAGESCSAQGACEPKSTKSCDDGNQCTLDVCNHYNAVCTPENLEKGCDDGDGCTVQEQCFQGKCHAEPGLVWTVAGGGVGFNDGKGAWARFSAPYGVAAGAGREIWVADTNNHRIRHIDGSAVVTTAAGTGVKGYVDGKGANARFSSPRHLAVNTKGEVFIWDAGNHRVRKLAGGVVSTLAGSGQTGYQDGPGSSARFSDVWGLAADDAGNVFVSDTGNHRIRKVAASGTVSTFAGTGSPGYLDGMTWQAQFKNPRGIDLDGQGRLWIADASNFRIRRIDTSGQVTTVAGSGVAGHLDGAGSSARFNDPLDVAVNALGEVLVADRGNRRVRRISPQGQVSTLAGSGASGSTDGPGPSATFANPYGIAVAADGTAWVADTPNHRIRAIGHPAKLCTDGNPCTTDACDAKTGKCASTDVQDGAPCADGAKPCTVEMACKVGQCQGGVPKSCDDKNTCTTDLCDPKSGACVHTPTDKCMTVRRVFLSSGTWNGNLGGWAGADSKCQAAAMNAGLGGKWMAWISAQNVAPETRFNKGKVPYLRIDGEMVAKDWADLTDGKLDLPINVDEKGGVPGPSSPALCSSNDALVFTNTTAAGKQFTSSTKYSCAYWKSSTSSSWYRYARYGRADATNGAWTLNYCGSSRCHLLKHLYCFEQTDAYVPKPAQPL